MLCVNYQKISVRPSSLLLSGVLSLWVSNKTDSNIDIFIAPGDAGMGVNIIMCDVMRSQLVLFSSRSAAFAGVLLPSGDLTHHTSHITVYCHDITLLSPASCVHNLCVNTRHAWERLMVRGETITESEQSGRY